MYSLEQINKKGKTRTLYLDKAIFNSFLLIFKQGK